ncbi:sensor histidine kinase [Miniphocaeibacter massiliensis]|uniref:sensor histidine kinase n=1 Tax=Miniphocaeibacter massiliensis TaxID=2041841 RepID=UPI0013EC7828|nr:HAMP domain-containing sensor histidine kinase [Miniphocaeibacter massiliensis]
MKKITNRNIIIIVWSIIFIIISIFSIITTKQIILIPIFILIWFFSIILLFLERKSFEKEVVLVSKAIEEIMNNGESKLLKENSEEITSKIEHQLNKLSIWVNEYNKKIVNDSKNMQELISEIAHQLRTPLLNIKTYSNFLQGENISDEEKNKYTNAIIYSEEKIDFLIESFIKISRFENKLIQIKKTNNELNQTILNAMLHVHEKAKEKNINILFNKKENIQVEHDVNWIEEVLSNILDNSIKYSPINSKIEININKTDMFTEISIRDYGIGIGKGEENKIFKRFYRGGKVTNEEGFGIGLYLAREIILKHGGFIKVKRENPGLKMQIYL